MEGKTTTKLVNSSTIAQIFGVSTQWVQTLTRNGTIHAVSDKGGYKYDLLQTIKAYIAHLQAKAEEKDDWRKEAAAKTLKADAGLKEAKARIAALELEELEDKMIPIELIEAARTDLLLAIEEQINELPERLKGIHKLDNSAEISHIIDKEAKAILWALSEYRFDPEVYEKRKAAYEARTRETGSILTAKRGGKTS